MDKILQALYDSELHTAEPCRAMIQEYAALRKKHYQHYDDFIKKLGSPLDKEFMEIMDEQFDTLPFECSQMFIDGFRLGAKIIIEVYVDR